MKRLMSILPGPGLIGLLLILAVVLAACSPAVNGSNSGSSQPTALVPVTGGASVQSANNAQLGQILVTPDGKTLYTNTADTPDHLVCVNADCTSIWKPYTVDGQPTAGSGIMGSLGLVTRPDGSKQVTYNQKPLYTFVQDTGANDVKGNGLTDLGGTWQVISLGNAPAVQPTSSGGSGGGGGGGGY